jgi:hypothetical protein
MKLKDLIETFREPSTINLAIFDTLEYLGTAPADSILIKPYLNRKIAWIDILQKPENGDLNANLSIMLEFDEEDDRVCPAADI